MMPLHYMRLGPFKTSFIARRIQSMQFPSIAISNMRVGGPRQQCSIPTHPKGEGIAILRRLCLRRVLRMRSTNLWPEGLRAPKSPEALAMGYFLQLIVCH